MLDRIQRTTVETVREYRGKIKVLLDNEEQTVVTPAFADRRLNKDIALALQGYFARMNKYYGDELKADL